MTRGVLDDPRCRTRYDAMISRINAASIEIIEDSALKFQLLSLGAREDLARGGLEGRQQGKRLIAFARMEDDEVFPGYSWRELRNGKKERQRNGVLCHSAVEIQSVVGCPFDCTYCPYTGFICVRLDVENFVDKVGALALERPSQTLFKLNNRSDTFGLEPEYGLSRALVERFAKLENQYLLLYSKGDEVDALIDLDHQGKSIVSFTLTPEAVASFLEVGAPSPADRIRAIARLSDAGYPIRVRFSPIVPLRGWREAYRDLIEQLMAVSRPELITMWTLSMINVADIDRIVPREDLDEEILAAALAGAEQTNGQKGAPFPAPIRALIYRDIAALVREISPRTKVSLCLENEEVWDAVADLVVPRRGADFVCNCGPKATPELVRLASRSPTT